MANDPSSRGPHESTHDDPQALAHALEPALLAENQGRLGNIEWFHATWQRGGAATGWATFEHDGAPTPVMVKIPVGPNELRWTAALGAHHSGAPTPRLFASGTTIGGHDLGWVVIERVEGARVSSSWRESTARDLLAAAAGFQQAAMRVAPPRAAVTDLSWPELLDRARHVARHEEIPEGQRWNKTLKALARLLPDLHRRWNARAINAWCHGDLHPGNAICHPQRGVVLIDLALVHPGHWVEDAVYLERQFWGHPEGLFGVKPVAELAERRAALGLSAADDHQAVARVRRILSAGVAPALHEGGPRYLKAALEVLDREIRLV